MNSISTPRAKTLRGRSKRLVGFCSDETTVDPRIGLGAAGNSPVRRLMDTFSLRERQEGTGDCRRELALTPQSFGSSKSWRGNISHAY